MRLLITILTILLFMSRFSDANAQFRGDVFFEVPSISAQSGAEVNLSVAAFTGADVFGSADIILTFDGSLFEVIEINFPDELSGVSTIKTESGATELRIIAANGKSFTRPSGIASFATIKGTVLADSGTTINFTSQNRNVFLANQSEITNSSFDAEVVVTALSVSSLSKPLVISNAEARIGSYLYKRALKLASNGSFVKLAQPDGTFTEVIIIKNEN